MQRRGMVIFILLNILISATVAFLVLQLGGDEGGGTGDARLVTYEVIITATRDPDMTPQVVVVTATRDPNSAAAGPQVDLPPDVVAGDAAVTPAPTLDPTALAGNSALAQIATGLPPNCIAHVVDSGENPSIIADLYGANLFELLTVNDLTEETAVLLQIGDILIVPLEGCSLLEEAAAAAGTGDGSEEGEGEDGDTAGSGEEGDGETGDADSDATATANADATATAGAVTPTPSPTPTITLAPTAVDAQIEITEIVGRGDITREQVVLFNSGATVDVTGWTLQDTNGNVYTFPDGLLFFSNAPLRINTRADSGDEETPIVKFWGRDTAVFGEPGDAVLLFDADGEAQAVLRLDEAGADAGEPAGTDAQAGSTATVEAPAGTPTP